MAFDYKSDLDVPDDFSYTAISACAAECLTSKGFCVMDTAHCFANAVGTQALEEAKQAANPLAGASRMQRPSSLITDGLLGFYGSSRVAWITPNDEAPLGKSLLEVQSSMFELAKTLQPEAWMYGGMLARVTPSFLHETGATQGHDVGLSVQEVEYWSQIFMSHKIMCLHFLGPGRGSLELKCFENEELDPVDVPTGPGITVLLRADKLLHEHRSMKPSYVVSSFFLDPASRRMGMVDRERMHPVAREIDDFFQTYLKDLKQASKADEISLSPSISRERQMMMNRTFVQGDNVPITGVQCRYPAVNTIEVANSALQAGFDACSEVPVSRWDHEQYYDPNPGGWRSGKTWTMHMGIVEGVHLFDNKFFLISPAEAERIDPQERLILECGFECMSETGMQKKAMMDSDIGFLLATTAPEFMLLPQGVGQGDLATKANRIAFCLGLKGTNMAVDCDHASSLVIINLAMRELGHGCENMCTQGIYLNLSPALWHRYHQDGWLNPRGRCFAFGDDGNGFVRGDGIGTVFMQREASYNEEKGKKGLREPHGVLSGSKSRSQGALLGNLTSPHAPAIQRIIAESLYDSKLSPLDVDAVECDAKGKLLDDCVETAAIMQVLRPYGEDNNEPLAHHSVKSLLSNSWYSTAICGVLKQLQAGKCGSGSPVGHLAILNPYLADEIEDRTVQFSTELLENRAATAINGVMALGWGGTACYVQLWVQRESKSTVIEEKDVQSVSQLTFWANGNAESRKKHEAEVSYYILGSWSGWEPEFMEPEGNGYYGYTITLGLTGWETFQFCLDADRTQVLHPAGANVRDAISCSPSAIQGPDQDVKSGKWMIDGLPMYDYGAPVDDSESDYGVGSETAPPGTKYRVTLAMIETGGYVSWKMLKDKIPVPLSERDSEQLKGKFYIFSQRGGADFIPMRIDQSAEHTWFAEVVLPSREFKFVICRNRDWNQVFYPAEDIFRTQQRTNGPDGDHGGRCWEISGTSGLTYRIELRWNPLDAGFDEVTANVSWALCERTVSNDEVTVDKKEIKEALWERLWARKKIRARKDKAAGRPEHEVLGSEGDGEQGIWTSSSPDHKDLGDAGEGVE